MTCDELFIIGEDGLVELNKIWIQLVPAFKKIHDRDKGSEGDYRGSKKLKARKEFTYISFHSSFRSPLFEYEEHEKHIESLRYAMLEKVDDVVLQADQEYRNIILKGTRSLRTYKNLLKTLDALDTYYAEVDFTLTDKRSGMLVNSPDSVGKSIERLDKVYDAIESFKRRVDAEMRTGGQGIRGTAEFGDNEATDSQVNSLYSRKDWVESEIQTKSEDTKNGQIAVEVAGKKAPSFIDLANTITEFNKNDVKITQAELDAIADDDEEDKKR